MKEGVTFELDDPRDHLSRYMIRTHGWYEKDLLDDILARNLKGVAIDVGAHIGNHSLWMAKVCGLEVVAFEPNPVVANQLERNVGINSADVKVLWLAAGSKKSQGRLVQEKEGNTGSTYLEDGDGPVSVVPIDELALDRVSVLKVDVEGRETDVLSGALDTIARCRPVIYAEAKTPQNRFAIEDILSPFGYALFGSFGFTTTLGYAA